MVNLGELERAIGLSIGYTIKIWTRFGRFADEVERLSKVMNLEVFPRSVLKAQLEDALERILNKRARENEILDQQNARHLDEGYGRLDALNRIGNQVFFANFLSRSGAKPLMSNTRLAANFARHTAPVSFPPIWSTPWFSWAQYDASVQNELVRNAGEALGVNARINLTEFNNPQHPTFRSSVKM